MKRLMRSAMVGVVATATDLTTLTLLVEGLGVADTVANVPGLMAGVIVQYVGNKYLAFRDHTEDHMRQGSLFALVEAGTLTLNAVGFHLVVTHTALPYQVARLAVSFVVYVAYSYPMWRRIFRPDTPREP